MSREPVFNLRRHDWAGALLTGLVVAAYLAQSLVPDVYVRFGLSAGILAYGFWWTLLTHMFVHGGIAHVFFNATALFSFSRSLSARVDGLALIALFLLSGLAGAAVFLAINPDGSTPMVGASGAVCGLWGAAARLAPVPVGAAPLTSAPVRNAVGAFALMNLILFAILWVLSGGQGGLAWESHLGGFLVGLFLGPFFARRTTGPWG